MVAAISPAAATTGPPSTEPTDPAAAAGAASRPPGPGLRSGPPARPLAGGRGPGRRQGFQCPVQGAGQRYLAVQSGQPNRRSGPTQAPDPTRPSPQDQGSQAGSIIHTLPADSGLMRATALVGRGQRRSPCSVRPSELRPGLPPANRAPRSSRRGTPGQP